MEILIVAKTHMKDAFCIGAFDITNNRNVRLLTSAGDNQPKDTSFNIGDVWNIEYKDRAHITWPHTEDVLVQSAQFMSKKKSLPDYILNKRPVWEGPPSILFDGKISFPIGISGYLNKKNVIQVSVGFWKSDKDLELTILDDKKHYLYFGEQVYSLPYVGAANKVDTISKGTLIRVSLTRWWSPNIKFREEGCYCQLSGWYN